MYRFAQLGIWLVASIVTEGTRDQLVPCGPFWTLVIVLKQVRSNESAVWTEVERDMTDNVIMRDRFFVLYTVSSLDLSTVAQLWRKKKKEESKEACRNATVISRTYVYIYVYKWARVRV